MLAKKTKYLVYGLAFLFFTDFIFVSCIEENYPIFYLSSELKSWGGFKTGSYWVYAVDSLELEDSIYVYYYDEGFSDFTIDDKIQYSEETMETNMENGNSYFYIGLAANKNDTNSIIYNKTTRTFYISEYVKINYKNNFLLPEKQTGKIEEIDSILILNKWYYNILYVKEIQEIFDSNSGDYQEITIELWFAKNIGIVKKHITSIYENHMYNLKRYSVLQ